MPCMGQAKDMILFSDLIRIVLCVHFIKPCRLVTKIRKTAEAA